MDRLQSGLGRSGGSEETEQGVGTGRTELSRQLPGPHGGPVCGDGGAYGSAVTMRTSAQCGGVSPVLTVKSRQWDSIGVTEFFRN